MKKQDWLDYFEAVNGRSPELNEIEAARMAGEFVEEVSQQAQPVQEQVQGEIPSSQVEPAQHVQSQANHQGTTNSQQAQFTQQQVFQGGVPSGEQGAGQFTQQLQQNPHVEQAKKYSLNYFNWFVEALKNPVAKAEVSNFNYAAITLGLSALLLGYAIINLIRRILLSIANMSAGSMTLRSNSPEHYDRLISAISSEFGLGSTVGFSLFILAIYVVAILIPSVVEKMANNGSQLSFKEEFGKSSQFLPILLILNVGALLVTFLVKSSLVISENFGSSVSSLVQYAGGENPFSAVTSYLALAKQIPALESIGSAISYLLIISCIGVLVLLVAMINNIQVSFKNVNRFYISILAVFVFIVATYFIDKMLLENIVKHFESVWITVTN